MANAQVTLNRWWASRILRAGVVMTLAALAALALTAATGDSRPVESRETAASTAPLFASPEQAGNPQKLHLLVDESKVVGWIGGKGVAPQKVQVRMEDKSEEVELRNGTFTWNYEVSKPTAAEISFQHCYIAYPHLKQTVTLLPRQTREPTVFFVVDRSLYRPGQPLHFAGFLRRLDEKGDFVPVANEAVEVRITSEQKKTVAGKVELTSDDSGRIIGSYSFVDADARDSYVLSIPKYRGTARVALAEYRKSKIKLKIAGALEGSKLRLKFEAVDFLDKPIGGSKVQFTAQVLRQHTRSEPHALRAEEFVYHEKDDFELGQLPGLSEEELLLWEAGHRWLPAPGTGPTTVVMQIPGEVPLSNKEPGEHVINVTSEWLDGNYSVIVQGVLIDENGREQRATEFIPLKKEETRPGHKALQVSLPKRTFEVGEKIPVTVQLVNEKGKNLKGSSSLVAMRLVSTQAELRSSRRRLDYQLLDQLGSPNGGYYPRGGFSPNGGFYGHRYRDQVDQIELLQLSVAEPQERFRRTLADAVAFQGSQATLKLAEPGAYKLIVISHLANGSKLQEEVGCVVRPRGELPGMVLNLDKSDINSGEPLTGTIHSRFANAQVLLAVRDSTGYRLWKPMQLEGSTLRLKEPLPQDLRYGSTVEVQYIDEAGKVHQASQFLRVNPVHRQLTIQTAMKEVCAPGEKVKIDLQVNRKEPVDLVVSVYDQALLGIAPDRSADPRHFFLADETVLQMRDLLRRKLGDLTVDELLKRAQQMAKEQKPLPPGLEGLSGVIDRIHNQNFIYSIDVAGLLALAGVEVRLLPYYQGSWHYQHPERKLGEQKLFNILQKQTNGWRLSFQRYHDLLVMSDMHPSFAGAHWQQQALLQGFGRGDYRARGDAHFSTSGNSSHSFAQGQGSFSHQRDLGALEVPAAPVQPLSADGKGSDMVRRDFSDLAFWKANVRTDESGKASVEFKLPDSLTNWQVMVTAVSKDLHVGQHRARFRTFKPIMVWPMLPRVFAQGDRMAIYASVHNRTDERQTIRVKAKVENGTILSREETSVVVEPRSNVPVYWTFQPKEAGFTEILMTADCQAGSDASLKRLPVVAVAAEQAVTLSGFCKDTATLRVPDGVDLKTASLEITFSPSLAADMADTLNFLVEYPHGCVEQTMSRFLPAIKVAQILKQFQINHPELEKKLPNCVEGGIKRLLELQQADGGWGWHGGSQTHEMMTPYALYGLLQAEKAGYRIPREDAIQKGLVRLKGFIDAMGEAQTADRIYCMYVYSHREKITDDGWKFIADQLEKKRLSDYALALALEMAVQQKQRPLADKLVAGLRVRAQKQDGKVSWHTAGFSRWGNDPYEVTAAALKALVAYDHDDKIIPDVLAFFAATKRGNRWNSTKDTAMIVYAICDYLAKQDFATLDKHVAAFEVNGANTTRVAFEDKLTARVVVPSKHLKKGDNKLTFISSSPGVMYRAVLRYWQNGTDIAPLERGIRVTRNFYLLDQNGQPTTLLKPGDSVPRGAYIQSEVTASHMQGANMTYVLVEDAKPSGCEFQPVDDRRFPQPCTPYALREEKEAQVAYHHEYAPSTIVNRCVLHAELAGEFLVPPAVVELMYETATRGHSGTFSFKVVDPEKVGAERKRSPAHGLAGRWIEPQ